VKTKINGSGEVEQVPLPLFFGYAYVCFSVGEGNVQLLPLLQNIGVADDLSACVFDDGEAALQNLLRRDGFEQGGLGGQASDIEIHARELLKIKEKLNRLMAKHCGRDLADLERDTDRDNFMSAEEAKEYGLIDQILENRASLQL